MITSFSISGFRGVDTDIPALEKYQVIIGENGSGKTHILEGIHLLSGGTLHYFQAPRGENASFQATVDDTIGQKSYSLVRRENRDIYSIQGSPLSGKKYRESFPFRTVFISPFDMNLLYFAPSTRREYIDSILDRWFGQFRLMKREYEGIMRQRNALLKSIRNGEAKKMDLEYWDKAFAEKAYLYSLYRKKWYTFLENQSEVWKSFLPDYVISPSFEESIAWKDATSIQAYLLENRERDILTGHTHIGPHLDDFGFFIEKCGEKIDASLFLSRWENKILLLALKQCEIFFLQNILHLPIILLFDDLFAELDMRNVEILIEKFRVDQMIVTSQRDIPKNEKWSHFSCINLTPA